MLSVALQYIVISPQLTSKLILLVHLGIWLMLNSLVPLLEVLNLRDGISIWFSACSYSVISVKPLAVSKVQKEGTNSLTLEKTYSPSSFLACPTQITEALRSSDRMDIDSRNCWDPGGEKIAGHPGCYLGRSSFYFEVERTLIRIDCFYLAPTYSFN